MTDKTQTKILYLVVLFCISFLMWKQIYEAQFLVYDENYGNLLSAFFISVCSIFGLIIIWEKWKSIILESKWQTLLFLLLSSPITIIIVCLNYKSFFGVALKV